MNVSLEKNFEFFLKTDFLDYEEGEWLAIHCEKVISHGKNLKEVIRKAKETAPIAKVLITKVRKTAR